MLFNVTLRFLGNPNPIVKCPCGSASTRTTFFPDFTSPAPRLIVVVVLEKHKELDVLEVSDAYANKGTSKYFRVYVEVEEKE